MSNAVSRLYRSLLRRLLAPSIVDPVVSRIEKLGRRSEELAARQTRVAEEVRRELLKSRQELQREFGQYRHESRKAFRYATRRLQELRHIRYREAFGSLAVLLRRDQGFRSLATEVIDAGRTLLSYDRLYTLWQAVRNVRHLNLPAAEVGCYRGGSVYFLAGAFEYLLGHEVELHAFDTFVGHPASAVETLDIGHRHGMFADVSYEDVVRYLQRYQHLSVHKGDIAETLQTLGERSFALVHVDADLYQSTRVALSYFLPRLAPGGIVVVDDYGARKCPGVRRAAAEYFGDRWAGFSVWELPSEQLVIVRLE